MQIGLNYVKDRWAAASGFDGKPVDPRVALEVVVLCCAIKPLCAWNAEACATTSRWGCCCFRANSRSSHVETNSQWSGADCLI
jgi:hypothetical protein